MPNFTPSQSNAVEYRRQDACVVAGPGSGKTTVLVERYRSLIVDHLLRTDEILAITFTEKAAANIKSKLASIFESDHGLRRELESAWVSTIHGFCSRLLKQNAVAAGIDPRFVVLDERQSDRLQRECLAAAVNYLAETRREDALALIEALHYAELTGPLQTVYDAIRSSGMRVEDVRLMPSPAPSATVAEVVAATRTILSCWAVTPSAVQRTQQADLLEWLTNAPRQESLQNVSQWKEDCPANLARCPQDHKDTLRHIRGVLLANLVTAAADREYAPFREMVFDVLQRFDTLYKDRKNALGALDFNDLERYSIQLLHARTEVRKRLNEQFRQIMLDEFQDINDQQWQLLELLRGPDTFFAVGDINQSIYGFRHARPEIFENYQQQTANKHYTRLFENFRSRQQILSSVEALLHERDGIQPRTLNAGKVFPEKHGPFIEIIKTFADEKTVAADLEGQWIAHRLLSMRHRTIVGEPGKTRAADFSDFAVLVRTGEGMRPILEAFRQANIPFVSSRQDSFLTSREGLDLSALLHVISNPRDEIQLATVLRSPLVAASDEALLRLRLTGWSITDGLRRLESGNLDPQDAAKLQRFRENLHRWRQEQPVLALDLLLVRALADCGYDWSPNSAGGDNVESYLHLARTTGTKMSLTEFLDEVESLCDAIDKEADLSDDDQGNRVQVLTAHAAKGLEFPVVFVAAMDKEGRHGSGALSFTPRNGLGIRWRSPNGSRDGIKDGWHVANGEAVKSREQQESNRLLYVAMTRAEEHLVLSYSATARKTTEWALILEGRYGLKDRMPSDNPFTTTDRAPDGREFEVQIRVAASAPEIAADSIAELERAGVAVLPRPAISGQYDSVVNVTALTVFNNCPRKYYLQRYVGAKSGRFLSFDPEAVPAPSHDADEVEDLSAAELGTGTHSLLAGVSGDYPEEARRLADVFTKSELGQEAVRSNPQREWEFIVSIEGVLVRGVIDLWFERGDETVIVDYKTDHVKPEHVVERAGIYATQLAFYAMAIKRKRVRGYLHFLHPDVLLEITLDAAAFERARELVRSLSGAQEKLNFPLHEAEHCKRCTYWRRQCPAGREQEFVVTA